MSLLTLNGLTMRFGGLTAVDGLELSIRQGEIFSVIGPNGAGKTTVFNAVTGIYQPTQGTILFQNSDMRRPLNWQTWASLVGIALLTGMGLASLYFIEDLWRVGIVDNFTAPPFPWSKMVADVGAFLFQRRWLTMVIVFLGALVGGGGAFCVWLRTRRTPESIAAHGIARTFQNIRLFQQMTVWENVIVALEAHGGRYLPWSQKEQKIRELLTFAGLQDRQEMLAQNLPYGAQRRLEIVRAMATEPKLLLLDEPAAGMNPAETTELMDLVRKIRQRGITVVLIEHHMKVVMGISDRIAVLDHGEKIAEGTPSEIQNDPRVIEAYLGKEEIG